MRPLSRLIIVFMLLGASVFCREKVKETLPLKLPFSVTRNDRGQPLSESEVAGFTISLTGLWKDVDYFRWVIRTSHGWDGSQGKPDYSVWWEGVEADKSGDTVTFRHLGTWGPDNIMIPTSKVLSSAASGYLLTGDPAMGKVVEQYSKGISATMMAMVWNSADPLRSIMARAVLNNNHEYVQEGGRKTKIDYTLARQPSVDWNTHTIELTDNPFWGDIWVKNMRSKDDVPHIYRADFFLRYVAEYGKDAWVRDAAAKALKDLQGFARDIVESGYHIRSKDENGNVFIPDQDLASFVDYDGVSKTAECNAKLATALIGFGDPMGNACASGSGGLYDDIAAKVHYYNRAIIRGFHMDAVLHSLLARRNAAARELLLGLISRMDKEEALPDDQIYTSREEWNGDFAVFLVQAAAAGVPLTSDEARLIHTYWLKAVGTMKAWNKWNLWSPAVPDGAYYPYRPDDRVGTSEIALLLEYCFSPVKNPTGSRFVDCDIVRDTSRW